MNTIYRDNFYINIDYGLDSLTSDQIYSNGVMLARILVGYGWTKNSVAGILGNVHAESGINPGCAEVPRPWGDTLPDNATVLATSYQLGMGFTQWTPGRTKIVQWADDNNLVWYDGMTQALRLKWECINHEQMARWDWFIRSHDDPADLAEYFLYQYERPTPEQAEQTLPARRNYATMWYNRIGFLLENSILLMATKRRKETRRPCRTI